MYDNGDNEEGMQMEINQYDVDSERDQTQVWGRWMEFGDGPGVCQNDINQYG